ncbi:MAG: hypothetical protein ACYC7D_12485 [Nitrososphaerales archaeon]
MSLAIDESNHLKETIADFFISKISNKVELDHVMPTRIVVDYFRLGEKGPCGTLSLRVRPILDSGFRMVPFKYVDRLMQLLRTTDSSKFKGHNRFRCIGISMDYDELVFRIEFENLQSEDLPNFKQQAFDPKSYKKEPRATWVEEGSA